MIVVTGGAGFVGSNLVHELNRSGRCDLVIVDNLTDARKFQNLVGAEIADYVDKHDFLEMLAGSVGWLSEVEVVFHQGACTSTTETDGRYVVQNNYDYSKALLESCLRGRIPLIYASSAAVYGGGGVFAEEPVNEAPLNVYGFSKLLFDRRVRQALPETESQVVGLRYFNVYGPREAHKGPMASLVLQLDDQLRGSGRVRLFGPTEGYESGEQRRDFVFVEDVVKVALWFWKHPERSGIFNCGTGTSRTFNELARQVIEYRGGGDLDYFPFPEALRGRYQSYTEADLGRLRAAGYREAFVPIEQGVRTYLQWRRDHDEGSAP